MRTDETDLPESVTAKRYAPPKAAELPNRPPRPVGFVGLALYLVFAAWTIAAATEFFPLGSTLGVDATDDHDVVKLLEREDVEAVLALVGVLPYLREEPTESVRCFSVKEVWLGTSEDDSDKIECRPLLVDERGETRSGLFGEPQVGAVVRHRLVAKVGGPDVTWRG